MKIAISSSGLGHVARGVESWAWDLAHALKRDGQDVLLLKGAGPSSEPWIKTLPTWKRSSGTTRTLLKFTRRGGWRLGLGNPYDIEQTSSVLGLWMTIGSSHDILHTQDPHIALLMDWLQRRGLSKARVILGHGTEESVEQLRRYSHLQHLAPWYLTEWEAHRPAGQLTFAVPNFVDTNVFSPGDRSVARREWDIPQDALVVLCVAAIRRFHKRIDYLLSEFQRFRTAHGEKALLIVAGATDEGSQALMQEGRELLGEGVRFLTNVPRQKLPSLYRACDVFTLASLHEMMPMALIEGLASGLPVACNNTPVLRWMVGEAGHLQDIADPGGLAAQFSHLGPATSRAEYSAAARARAVNLFSEPVVLEQVKAMYQAVLSRGEKPVMTSNVRVEA